jgi:hypothetical protein
VNRIHYKLSKGSTGRIRLHPLIPFPLLAAFRLPYRLNAATASAVAPPPCIFAFFKRKIGITVERYVMILKTDGDGEFGGRR